MSKCLVTGHLGYIGSRVFEALVKQGHDVRGIDLKQSKYNGDILEDLGHIHTSQIGLASVSGEYRDFKPEFIFHLAAIPRVPYSVEFPVEVLENNITSTLRVLEYARLSGAKRVIYSSSSSVVGNGNGPTSPYGASKLIPEILCKNYSDVYGVDTVSLRYFNVYSKDQEVDGPYATAIANFMHAVRQGHNPFITGDGEQRRDMLHVTDAVSANLFCMSHDLDFNGQSFDVATGSNISLNEVKEIINKYHPEVVFNYVGERTGDVRVTKADTEPLKKLGWTTRVGIKSGIEECFNF